MNHLLRSHLNCWNIIFSVASYLLFQLAELSYEKEGETGSFTDSSHKHVFFLTVSLSETGRKTMQIA